MSKNTAPINLASKFRDVEVSINQRLLEREEATRAALLAMLTKSHVLAIGEPGIAKSLQFRTLVSHIEAPTYFEVLLDKFTTPDLIFGPPSLKALENDEYRRITTGRLPEAQFAFLDEIFKSSSAVLNSLLTAINERLFSNPVPSPIPLESLFAASNEIPESDDNLNAIYDRFLTRLVVSRIGDVGNLRSLLSGGLVEDPPTVKLTIADIHAAQELVKAVTLTDDTVEAVIGLSIKLRSQSIEVSDRRLRAAMGLIKAAAWLDDRTETDVIDLAVLQNVMWTRIEQIAPVRRACLDVASPAEREVLDLISDMESLRVEFDDISRLNEKDSDRRLSALVQVGQKLSKIDAAVKALDTRDVSKTATFKRAKAELKSFKGDYQRSSLGGALSKD